MIVIGPASEHQKRCRPLQKSNRGQNHTKNNRRDHAPFVKMDGTAQNGTREPKRDRVHQSGAHDRGRTWSHRWWPLSTSCGLSVTWAGLIVEPGCGSSAGAASTSSMLHRHSSRRPPGAGCQRHTSMGRCVRSAAAPTRGSGRLSLECASLLGPDAAGRAPIATIFASFANIAHLHFRWSRQVGERETVG